MPPKGHIAFVLHFHLPWVLGHGKWPHGEDWLNEAVIECYLPLLQAFSRLAKDGVKNCVTLGLTPVLLEQFSSQVFREEFPVYISRKIDSAAKDKAQFEKEGRGEMVALATMWRDFFAGLKDYYLNTLKADIVGAFRSLQDDGVIEIITSAATHGYLPLLAEDNAINGQIRVGVETYRKRLGKMPRGFWLPECAYRPHQDNWEEPVGPKGAARYRAGIEKFLRAAGLQYTLVDTHMIKRSAWHGPADWRRYWKSASGDPFHKTEGDGLPAPVPRLGMPPPYLNGHSAYRPYELVGADGEMGRGAVCAFVRDNRTSLQVWSGQWGYPGDGRYLEFHKKHWPGGHRYWRVTDSKADLGLKQVYQPQWAKDAISSHVDHFFGMVKEIVISSSKELKFPPIVVCPFDAELFGHWWFEGPQWLEGLLRRFNHDKDVKPTTLGNYLDLYPPSERVSLPEGSWGEGGDYRVWFNQDTEWTWEKVYEIEHKVAELLRRASRKSREFRRIMLQLAREQLLLESSDWQFLITTGTARDYAEKRVTTHFRDASGLLKMAQTALSKGRLSDSDLIELEAIEKRDSCFSEIDPGWWK